MTCEPADRQGRGGRGRGRRREAAAQPFLSLWVRGSAQRRALRLPGRWVQTRTAPLSPRGHREGAEEHPTEGPRPPPLAPQPHLAQVPALTVLHRQQGPVVGSQALHAFRDVPGSHHIGMVQPRGEVERVRGADTGLTPAPQGLEVPGPGEWRGKGTAGPSPRAWQRSVRALSPGRARAPGAWLSSEAPRQAPPRFPTALKQRKWRGCRRHAAGWGQGCGAPQEERAWGRGPSLQFKGSRRLRQLFTWLMVSIFESVLNPSLRGSPGWEVGVGRGWMLL